MAARTASDAVSDPSVPTTIVLGNMCAPPPAVRVVAARLIVDPGPSGRLRVASETTLWAVAAAGPAAAAAAPAVAAGCRSAAVWRRPPGWCPVRSGCEREPLAASGRAPA